jgi:hypothetical protein
MHLLLFFLLSGCSLFLRSDGPVSAKDKKYVIEFNSVDWRYKKNQSSDYVYENQKDGRIHLSNSFCNEFQDQPLERLAHKTFKAAGKFKPQKGEYTTFSNREAYRLEGTGKVDGVDVELHLLNTRRDNCYFDFVSITPKVSGQSAGIGFDEFLKAVKFK